MLERMAKFISVIDPYNMAIFLVVLLGLVAATYVVMLCLSAKLERVVRDCKREREAMLAATNGLIEQASNQRDLVLMSNGVVNSTAEAIKRMETLHAKGSEVG